MENKAVGSHNNGRPVAAVRIEHPYSLSNRKPGNDKVLDKTPIENKKPAVDRVPDKTPIENRKSAVDRVPDKTENKRPMVNRMVSNTSSLDNRRPTDEHRVDNNISIVDNTRSAADTRVNTNTSSLVSRPKNKKRSKKTKEKKAKKKGNGCCCSSGDKVSGSETNVESETETERDSEPTQSCCCPCCPSRKNKKQKRKKSKKNSCMNCCKQLTTFFFSHIGLCSLVVAYSVFGGFVFMKLEAPHEVKERSNVAVIRHQKISKLWNITEQLNILHQKNWSDIAEKVFIDFQTEVFHATKHRGWDGKDGETELQWSFAGALLYSVTVITTIGYGHIAPKTAYGRLVTIFYALVGVPLTLLCLANMGTFLGNCFRCFYKRLCQFLMWLCCPPQSRAKFRVKKKPKLSYNTEGLPEEVHPLRSNPVDADNDVTIVVSDDVEEEKPSKEEPDRVPIIVSFIIIFSYIFGGAVLFSWWEEDWDYLIGSYFCFITLSTIGFGDYVPGSGLNSWSSQEKLIFCCVYLALGLSVIAMCFNLMQEEVRAKCRWLGMKLGFLDEDES